ncbi:MAG: replication initiator [Ornithinimicrobium sp.]
MSAGKTNGEVDVAFPGYGEASPLVLPVDLSQKVTDDITRRMLSPHFEDWADAASKVGHCAKPIRLRGCTTRYDTTTGEVLSSYSSSDEALGVTYVRCGNRREQQCPSCSRIYARDTFEMIRAGVTGGKTVPATVGDNPLVFATLTAPSFGHVHGTRSNGGRCRPRDTARWCEHGKSVACFTAHSDDDPVVGSPICGDCYDYDAHLVWQWWAPELWRRFTITLRRQVAHHLGVSDSRLPSVAVVQYAKVAEQQRRGVIHFHALIRLDGPKSSEGFAPAPSSLDGATLSRLIAAAASAVTYTAAAITDTDTPRVLRFGTQLDARPVTARRRNGLDSDVLSAEQVAGYLAKYATKAATDIHGSQSTAHLIRLRSVARDLADIADINGDYALLGKWVHMLGFRGHFSSKSRRYSVTLGQLRRARARFARITAQAERDGTPVDVADLEARLMADDDQETTLVVGQWSYAGSGWDNDGDTALALAAAARAKEYDQWRAKNCPRKQDLMKR